MNNKLAINEIMSLPKGIRVFALYREEDETGISGTGVVATGMQYPNGWCSLSWLSDKTSVAAYPDIETVKAIHGHGGKTKFVVLFEMDWAKVFDAMSMSFTFNMEGCYAEFSTPNHREHVKVFESLRDLFTLEVK